MLSPRTVQTILGLFWFFDGILQLKPKMFTAAFIQQIVLPTAEGQPHWIASIVDWGAHITLLHPVLWNVMFAVVQLVIGMAFIFNVQPRLLIIASVLWSTVVWVFGEGFGQLGTGRALMLTGAPGAVVIYALIAIALWPNFSLRFVEPHFDRSSVRFAQVAVSLLFLLGSALHLQAYFLTYHHDVTNFSVAWLANLTGQTDFYISLIVGVSELLIAILLLIRVQVRLAVWAAVIVSLLFWWLGQSFGQLLDPLATDFNSGIIMALLAVCAYPE